MQATPMTSTPMEGPGGQASPKEKYELLYGSMKDYYAGLVDFEYKHAGFLARMAGGCDPRLYDLPNCWHAFCTTRDWAGAERTRGDMLEHAIGGQRAAIKEDTRSAYTAPACC
jgi:hypothetical protein